MSSLQSSFSPDYIDNLHQFEALFNYATIGIVVTNNDGRIINFNRHAETQFGYTKEEVLGERVDLLLPVSARARHIKYREKYYEHPEPRVMGHGRDLFGQTKDGTTFPVEVSLSHYTINNETFVIAFVIDITVRKAHEALVIEQTRELERVTAEIKSMNVELEQKVEDRTKMLREALSELERSKEELSLAYENEKDLNELKSGFVTMASHEFRTPLSIILSSAYLLEKYNKEPAEPGIQKHINRIKNAVGGMKNILEDFLSLGKLEEGLVKTNMEVVSAEAINNILNELLQELAELFKPGQEIIFTNEVDHDVWVDKALLKNILINLISNAIKFTGEKGIIKVISFVADNNFMIAVEDNGIGISTEDQQYLFGRFFRASNAGNVQGTGLGLHIVSKYLDLMKGTISIKSEMGVRTIFTISIPQSSNQ